MKNRQDIFWFLTFGIGVFFVWLFQRGRRKTLQDEIKPLNLKAQSSTESAMTNLDATTAQVVEQERLVPTRALQVFFNYNGHTFDAYEVLGVPGGADLERVTQAYQQLKQTYSSDLIDYAYQAIRTQLLAAPKKENRRS